MQAVIGAGAAGLVAARELLREGHSVVVYEQADSLGGVWRYSPETDSELVGLDPKRRRSHSSTYVSLRTNLPREIMSFSDFPFIPEAMEGRSTDPRTYPHHSEVLEWLNVFADKFQICNLILFNRRITELRPETSSSGSDRQPSHSNGNWDNGSLPRWRVTSVQALDNNSEGDEKTGVYDAVVSCIGNYFEPNLPAVEGLSTSPLQQLHSHNYRSSKPFRGKTVLVVGAAFSGEEIARQIASVARHVYHSGRSFPGGDYYEPRPNLERVAMLSRLRTDGTAVLADERVLSDVDSIVYCTGYNYAYPFLEGTRILTTDQMRVNPLWRHIFVPAYAPSLAFIGLIQRSVRNCQFELQAKVVARALAGRFPLPDAETMGSEIAAFYQELEAAGMKMEHTHFQMGAIDQWTYNDALSALAGVPPTPTFIRDLHNVILSKGTHCMFFRPDSFRDEWLPYEAEAFEAARKVCLEIVRQDHTEDLRIPPA